MNMPPAEAAALKRQIADAFATAPYPGDDHLVDESGAGACADVVAAFRGKHWKELGSSELRSHSMHCLSISALHYYLPAYLFAALDDCPDLMPFTVAALSVGEASDPAETGVQNAWRKRRYDTFSLAEREAIRAFLVHARDAFGKYFFPGEIDAQLGGYWEGGSG